MLPTKFNPKVTKNHVIILLVIFIFALLYLFFSDDGEYEDDFSADTEGEWAEECNVAGVILQGDLYTYATGNDEEDYDMTSSNSIVYYIDEAEKDENIKAIVLEIDSGGGGAVAAEEVENALRRASKPTVALIRESGMSAAYWAATGADVIFASKNSDVGSIGITMSYLDNTKYNQKEGYTYNQLSTGKFKDTLDPDKPLTYEEKQWLQEYLDILLGNFVDVVAENRNLDVSKVRVIADNGDVLGDEALELGLIDRIGDIHDVENYLAEVVEEEVELCW
ncbi:MAG: S49 family peptidase [Patescibacteria group bacterium]|jgi:protease-4